MFWIDGPHAYGKLGQSAGDRTILATILGDGLRGFVALRTLQVFGHAVAGVAGGRKREPKSPLDYPKNAAAWDEKNGLRCLTSRKMRYHDCCPAEPIFSLQRVNLCSASYLSLSMSMSRCSSAFHRTGSILALTRFIAPLLLLTILPGAEGWAKEQPLNAIEQARKEAADGDLDGAAESYILFLNSSSDTMKTEREDAKRFLQEQFNVRQVSLAAS